MEGISRKGWSLISTLTHHIFLHTFLPQHKVLKEEKHLMMNLIELLDEKMKETKISEGENYKFVNLVILKCLSLKHA